MNLQGLLTEAAAGLSDVERAHGADGAVTWTSAGQAFAALSADGSVAEFRLDAAVAIAAERTPDTASSSRGPGWVSFRPLVLDEHSADRAVAWLASAHRRVSPA